MLVVYLAVAYKWPDSVRDIKALSKASLVGDLIKCWQNKDMQKSHKHAYLYIANPAPLSHSS
jgi:hypothetical protein